MDGQEKPMIGVVGLGTMGLGIAQVYAAAGFKVLATDGQSTARDTARGRVADALALRVASGKLSAQARDATLANLVIKAEPEALQPCALIIEAIIEDVEAKTRLFTRLQVASPQAILASNTSSLGIYELSEPLVCPDLLLGLHFFNPAPAMALVELIAHPTTSARAVTVARTLTEAAGKTVIQAPDSPGFIVNRCARPYYGEAFALLDEGHSPADIDGAMLASGYRLGPFALIDLIGADINLAATTGIYNAMARHPRYLPFPALAAQVASGNLGRKTGQGFVFPNTSTAARNDTIALRIEAAMINEACWLRVEGNITSDAIDTALKLAMNFPRGPFESLAIHTRPRILATLHALEAAAPPHLKTRYLPAPFLALT